MPGFITDEGASYLMALVAMGEPVVDGYWVALTQGVPAPYMTSDEIGEPDAPDYARAYIPADGTWVVSGDSISNSAEILWPIAETDWGDVSGWALLDAQDGGRVLYGGDLGIVWTIEADLQPVMAPGQLSITITVAQWSQEI